MKKYFLLLTISFAFYACNSIAQDGYYGAKITPDNTISVDEIDARLAGKNEIAVKVEGKVAEVCQAKGCWMTLQKADGSTMRVGFKDYAFFVPKNISGKTVIINGIASVTTTSVEELKHYAEDAKKSKEEIDAITTPKKEVSFEADGVIVK